MTRKQSYITVQQAADALQVPRRRVWQLIKQGKLHTEPNPLDRRSKLIPRGEIEELAQLPRAPKRRRAEELDETASGVTPIQSDRDEITDAVPWPQTVGIVSDGAVQSEDLEDYLREHWRSE